MLARTGLRRLEVTSFVRADVIPQLADGAEVLRRGRHPGRRVGVGADPERARPRATRWSCATASTRSTSSCRRSRRTTSKNVNRSIEESLSGLERVIGRARGGGPALRGRDLGLVRLPLRGRRAARSGCSRSPGRLVEAGCEEIAFGDTTGMANPRQVREFFEPAPSVSDVELTAHFHNTRGQGLANVLAALEAGVRSFESSFGELGGCPVPQGATGNVATEDLVSMLHEMGYETGIDLERLLACARARRRRCSAGRWAATCSPPGRSTGTERDREPTSRPSRAMERGSASEGERESARVGRGAAARRWGAEDVRARAVPLPAQLRLGARPPLARPRCRRSRRGWRRPRCSRSSSSSAAARSGCGGCCRRGRASNVVARLPARGRAPPHASCSSPTTTPPTPG